MNRPFQKIAAATVIIALPLAAHAHPGHALHASFTAGLIHPLTGWDHLLVLLCLGILAAGRSARLAVGAGALLVAALNGGAAFGLSLPQAAFVEPVILATVLTSASLLALRMRVGHRALLAMCLGFTLVHGMAHGQEAPSGNLPAYFAGFTLAALALYALGIRIGRALRPTRRRADGVRAELTEAI